MPQMKKVLRSAAVLVTAIFLSACSSTSDHPKVAVGIFTDGPVYGLSYVSVGQSGTTGADGSFTYEVDNTVRFFVGGVTIGKAAAKSQMTPVDLAKTLVPTANASNQCVVNIVRFLMSISTIDASTGKMTIDPSKVIGSASASDFNVSTYKFTTTLASISSGPKYTEAQAKAHFTGVIMKKEHVSGMTTDYVYYYTYSANGLMTKEEQDIDGNGTVDSVLTYTYDANGNNTRIDYDDGNNGTIDATMSYTYNTNSLMTKNEYKTGSTTVYIYYYTYDANGLMTKQEQDMDGDDTIDSVLTYTYDANGNNTRIDYDNDNNGTIDATMSYTYNTNGLMTKKEHVSGMTTDYVYYYTYSANGLMTKEEQDIDGNGTIDSVFFYTYYPNGNNMRIDYDNDNNGIINDHMYYTWQKI
jgi:hypothetical protein